MTAFGTYCRRACLVTVAAILTVCFIVSGCEKINKTEFADVREAFLTLYFTSNYNKRYDNWLRALDAAKDDKSHTKLTAAQLDYFSCFEEYVSENMLNAMIANNDNIKYEELAREKGITCVPTGFVFEEYSKADNQTTYTFVAHLILTNADGSETSGIMSGQITAQSIDGEEVISNFYLSPVGFIADEALPAR